VSFPYSVKVETVMNKTLPAIVIMALLLVFMLLSTQPLHAAPEPVVIYIFWGATCPYCHAEREFLTELNSRYPDVILREYEVYHDEGNRIYWAQMLAAHGLEPSGVPTTFIGDRVWIGFADSITYQIEAAVIACQQTGCADPGIGIVPEAIEAGATMPPVTAVETGESALAGETITLPLIGEVSLAGQSLWLNTLLIAAVDGFNPCSLWVISILLALVVHSGSRGKTLIVGLVYLLTTALVYSIFIAGLFSVLSLVSVVGWVQAGVALLALGFAIINIKEYFWYKEGISLTIANSQKPKIYRAMRKVIADDRSLPGLVGATVAMALGVTLLELPCTSGLPVLWANMVAAQEVPAMTFALLLFLYLLVFLVDELLVFGSVVFTLRVSRFEEKQGRALKLAGGMIMLALAITLLLDPTAMNNLSTSLLVFGAALGCALAVLALNAFTHARVSRR
jgi:cytochrome c biogenesis protein CcdA/glutaredoxin